MSETSDNLRLVWIDLEMTGLNAALDHILEVAAVVTGPDLVPLDQVDMVIFQPDEVLERMSDRVRRIHTDNNLLEEVRASKFMRADAERALLAMVSKHCPPGEGILSGSSVYHDWRFLVKFMPRLEQHLHFRQIDVGTIGVLVSAWFPQVEIPRPKTNHRAMSDVRASLEEMRHYCQQAFKVDLTKLATAAHR